MTEQEIEQTVLGAIDEFAKNPFWMEKVANAPFGAVVRMSLNFWYSENREKPNFEPGDYMELRQFFEDRLTIKDLKYLIAQEDDGEAKKHYEELLAKVEKEGDREEMTPPAKKDGADQGAGDKQQQ